ARRLHLADPCLQLGCRGRGLRVHSAPARRVDLSASADLRLRVRRRPGASPLLAAELPQPARGHTHVRAPVPLRRAGGAVPGTARCGPGAAFRRHADGLGELRGERQPVDAGRALAVVRRPCAGDVARAAAAARRDGLRLAPPLRILANRVTAAWGKASETGPFPAGRTPRSLGLARPERERALLAKDDLQATRTAASPPSPQRGGTNTPLSFRSGAVPATPQRPRNWARSQLTSSRSETPPAATPSIVATVSSAAGGIRRAPPPCRPGRDTARRRRTQRQAHAGRNPRDRCPASVRCLQRRRREQPRR